MSGSSNSLKPMASGSIRYKTLAAGAYLCAVHVMMVGRQYGGEYCMKSAHERRIQEIDAATLKGWLERGEALLVDVREPSEYQ